MLAPSNMLLYLEIGRNRRYIAQKPSIYKDNYSNSPGRRLLSLVSSSVMLKIDAMKEKAAITHIMAF